MANVKVAMAKTKKMTFGLKEWLDLDMLPLKMCVFVRYMCTPNIKRLSLLDKKKSDGQC